MKNLYLALLAVADTSFKCMSLLEIMVVDESLTREDYNEIFRLVIEKASVIRGDRILA